MLSLYNEQSTFPVDRSWIESIVTQVLKDEDVTTDEVIIHFVDVPKICQLHEDFFDDPSPTDCISFPMDREKTEEHSILGEVFVCPEIAKEYVESHGGELKREVSLYVIHGLLHLIGYDDIEDDDRQEMRSRETHHLTKLFDTRNARRLG